MNPVVIAIDAMGGDFGLSVTTPAVIAFLNKKSNAAFSITMVGEESQVNQAIQDAQGQSLLASGKLTIQHASEVVGMDEPPAKALKRKKDSSMRVSINLVKEGTAQAAVSAGNTGALMATARFVLRTIAGVDRPAICTTMPCIDPTKSVLMLDLGANVDSPPELLKQFAVMGMVLARATRRIESPSIALLNVGAEEMKGSEKIKGAAQLIGATKLNYVGFIEGDELYSGKVDVIVTDGFEGNVALKASEGTAKMVMTVLKEEFTRSWFTKINALMAKSVFKRMQSRLDPRSHNGATLMGLNGIVIKSHGGTDSVGFEYAIVEAATQAKRNIIGQLAEGVALFESQANMPEEEAAHNI